MADATVDDEEIPKKSSKLPLIIGVVLALVGGGGGFYAANSGMILATESPKSETDEQAYEDAEPARDFSFVPMAPLTISLTASNRYDHLIFRGELEVNKKYVAEVEAILPRIVDVLNSYLRALEPSDLENAASLTRLRSQMLHRVQIVAGPGRVNDVLIMEFVLN